MDDEYSFEAYLEAVAVDDWDWLFGENDGGGSDV